VEVVPGEHVKFGASVTFTTVETTCKELMGRGLHSFTFQLNVSAVYWTRGVCRGCVGGV